MHGWIAFALCLLENKTRRGLPKGAVVAPSSKEVTGTGQMPLYAGAPSGMLPQSPPGASIPAWTIHLKGHLAVQVGANDRLG